MPRRVNPVILLGIVTVAILSFGLSAFAALEDGTTVPEKDVSPNEVAAPAVEPSGDASSKAPAPESTTVPGEGKAPEDNVPVGDAVSGDDVVPENDAVASEEQKDATPEEDAAAPEEQENAAPEEVATPEDSPAQEGEESDAAGETTPEEDAEVGEVAEEAGTEFEKMLDEAESADGEHNKALFEENQLNNKIAETRNDLTTAEDSLGDAQGKLEDRASQMYKNGDDGFLSMLLGARDFSDFKDLLGLWVQVLDRDQKEVQDWRESRDQIEQSKQDLEAQLEEWKQTREEASTKKDEAENRVEQAQEFFKAQDEEVQKKIEEDRNREAELALDHAGKMLQDAIGEQPSEPTTGGKENSDDTAGEQPGQAEEDQSSDKTEPAGEQPDQTEEDRSSDETEPTGEQPDQAKENRGETSTKETTSDKPVIQLGGEDKSEEIEQARQTGAEAPDRTPEEEQVRQGEVAQAVAETIQEWQAQKKPLAQEVEAPVKEPKDGAAPEEAASETQAQDPAAKQAAAAEEQAKAQEQSRKAAEQAAAEKEAREDAAVQAEEADKAKSAVESAPAAEQEAARTAADEAQRNAKLAANKAAEKKQAAEDAAKQAVEQQDFAVELGQAAGDGLLDPNLGSVSNKPILGTSGSKVLDYAQDWLGVPYDYSHSLGMTRAGVDCSAFTAAVYKKFGITLPDSPVGQLGMGAPVSGPAKAGDLVFFSEDGSGIPTHVGIANGDGTLTHASDYTGEVSVTNMDYINGYMGARRLI